VHGRITRIAPECLGQGDSTHGGWGRRARALSGDDAAVKLLWLAIINIEDKRAHERARRQQAAKRSDQPARLVEGQAEDQQDPWSADQTDSVRAWRPGRL